MESHKIMKKTLIFIFFLGISLWAFSQKKIVVSQNGDGEFKMVQQGLDAVPFHNKKAIEIYIKNGVYKEKLLLDSTKNKVKIIGEDPFKTILTFDDCPGKFDAKGIAINTLGKRLSFFFNAHNNLFEEIAKFRAARTMWASIMKELGATDPKALMLRFHTQTGGATLTAQQPLNNISRVTIQTLAAVLGGTQSLHTNGYDEALNLPTEEAARIALRTQQIVAFESGAPDTVDPLAGSYFVESLTAEVEKKAWELIAKIDTMGGSVAAIESGFMQDEIAKSAYAYQKEIESGEKIIVGVNKFTINEPPTNIAFKIDDSIRQVQIEKINTLKQNRDAAKVAACIDAIIAAAKGTDNIMPLVVEAVEYKATLGEISNAFRSVFGEF